MSGWIDVSAPLEPGMACWPGSIGFRRHTSQREEAGDHVLDSVLEFDAHVGTHLDAPAHYLRDGATVEATDLDACIGPALVVRIAGGVVDADALAAAVGDRRPQRLLLKTDNGSTWPGTTFPDDWVALDESGAAWCIDHGVRLVGIDFLSVQSPDATAETHRILLRAGVVILEGLVLRDVAPGTYELTCLPLSVRDGEGAPARALLRPSQETKP